MKYKIEILRNNIPIGLIDATDCQITYNSKAKIKRACSITCSSLFRMNSKTRLEIYKGDEPLLPMDNLLPSDNLILPITERREIIATFNEFNKMKDRIRVMANDTSLGIFMISSLNPTYNAFKNQLSLELYDETYILSQSKFDRRRYFPVGTNYVVAIRQLLVECGFNAILSDNSNYTLMTDREFEIGTSYIDCINALLEEIGFESVYADADGIIHLTKKVKKEKPDFIYRENKASIIKAPYTSEFDIFNLPNVFVGVMSNPEQEPITYVRENHNFDSSISIENRGYKVVQVYTLSNVASEDELHAYIDDVYSKSMNATEVVKIDTALEFNHEFRPVVQLDLKNIKGLFDEVGWSLDINSASSSMKHTLERSVAL